MHRAWHPPFCPNPDCPMSHDPVDNWAIQRGSFETQHSGSVTRFQCSMCRKNLSASTFRIEFRAKLKLNLRDIQHGIDNGCGIRSIARTMKQRPETIINRINRLSRQAIALQVLARQGYKLEENLAADGMESFTYSQFFPTSISILMGTDSQFCHVADYSVSRRKGSMTMEQRQKRDDLDLRCPFPKRSLAQSVDRIFNYAYDTIANSKSLRTLNTDEHPEYRRSVKRIFVKHEVETANSPLKHVSTSSKAPRTFNNPLMSVNYMDREIRKDCANHTRETLQWSHEANNCMSRFYLFLTTHNFLKPYRIKKRHDSKLSHAEVAGVDKDICTQADKLLFGQRVFYTHLQDLLLPSEKITWLRQWPNPHGDYKDHCWPYMTA